MATRLYLTSRMPNTNLQGPPLGEWSAGDSDRENRGNGHWTLLANDTNVNGGVNSVGTLFGASITKEDDQPIFCRRWVTPTLEAITLSGNLQLCIKATHGSGTGDEAALKVYAYITVGNTLTERTVLIDNFVDPTQITMSTPTWTSLTSAQAVAGAVSAGDRIVVEVGAVCSPATSPEGDNNVTLYWGTTNSSLTPLSDATAGATTAAAAWVEFSDTIVPQAPAAAPVNDACADATAISSVPFVSVTTDTTTSTDTDRAVWWAFTPDTSGWYFASTMGSNGSATVDIYTGGCGVLNNIAGSGVVGWLGSGQAMCPWEATSGTPYLIKVADLSFVSGSRSTVTAKDSGCSLILSVYPQETPAEVDDLVVNCQHVATIRNGQIVNITDRFYGDTPTASAIDYTLRPMDDFNGGLNTSRRLYLALFGATPIIEIIDLETLNADPSEDEIDYIIDAINTGGENLSSLVFSLNVTGLVYLGFYGDEYSVLGGTPSSEASSAIRYLDATHADNQAGAPWPVADEWPVDRENQGSDFTDLAVNQETMYYTSAGTLIKSINVDTGVQGGNVALVPDAPGPRPGLRGLRTLPPGDGTAGWLVTAGSVCYWIDATGNIVQTYTPSPASAGQDLDKLEITNNGQTFWVSDQYSTWLFQFDITSGAQLASVNLNFPAGQLSGFSIVNGYRSGGGTDGEGEEPPEPPEPTPGEFGTEETLEIVWERTTPILSDENLFLFHKMLTLDMQVGTGLSSGQGVNPLVRMTYSDDGGMTWSNEILMEQGRMGAYDTLMRVFRLGRARNRVYKFRGSDPVAVTLIDCYIEASRGTH